MKLRPFYISARLATTFLTLSLLGTSGCTDSISDALGSMLPRRIPPD